jgi:hypothetical protein
MIRLLSARLFVFFFLVAIRMTAQSEPSDLRPPAPDALTVPNAPSVLAMPSKVIDKKFVAVMGALAAAESLRFTTRTEVVEREFAAGVPWITSTPAHPAMIARDGALFASEMFVAYEMKKPHQWLPGDRILRRLWWAYPVAMTILHTKNAIGNIRTTGAGGCTSIAQCEAQMQGQGQIKSFKF